MAAKGPSQTTDKILMIRPKSFGFNSQTGVDNVFQSQVDLTAEAVSEKVRAEFDGAVSILSKNGVNVTVYDDHDDSRLPDSVFSNNWITTHESGTICLYPMKAELRRKERRNDVVHDLIDRYGYDSILDMSVLERKNMYLEGTGSMVLDRSNRIAYICLSHRSHRAAVERWCDIMNYKPFLFEGVDPNGNPLYHTNVVMALGENQAVVYLDSVQDNEQMIGLAHSLRRSKKELITLNWEQVESFAGNMLQLRNKKGDLLWIASKQAYESLSSNQISDLRREAKLVVIDVTTIESIGGGSIRCMITEIFSK